MFSVDDANPALVSVMVLIEAGAFKRKGRASNRGAGEGRGWCRVFSWARQARSPRMSCNAYRRTGKQVNLNCTCSCALLPYPAVRPLARVVPQHDHPDHGPHRLRHRLRQRAHDRARLGRGQPLQPAAPHAGRAARAALQAAGRHGSALQFRQQEGEWYRKTRQACQANLRQCIFSGGVQPETQRCSFEGHSLGAPLVPLQQTIQPSRC